MIQAAQAQNQALQDSSKLRATGTAKLTDQ